MKDKYLTPSLEIVMIDDDILTSSPNVDPDIGNDQGELPWQDW